MKSEIIHYYRFPLFRFHSHLWQYLIEHAEDVTAGKQERESIPTQASKDAPFISPIWVLVALLGAVACVRKMK